MKTLSDWLAHLEGLHPKGQAGIVLGLDRIRLVKEALGQVPYCPVIVVGGTNGKGSTCAYLENIIAHAGYKLGCYTSPHLQAYNERVESMASQQLTKRCATHLPVLKQHASGLATSH